MSVAPDVITDDDLPRTFGSYLLLQNFARGGMGDVYLAKSGGIAGLERVCVLKKLRSELTKDREYVTRFIDEARVVVTLNHANICNVFDVGRVDDEYYLAMEYVSGRDVRALQERCRKLDVLPPAIAALYVTCEVLEALDYAHRRHHPVTQEPLHLVHRDISPQNVLVSYEGEVKLIDFGLAASRLKVERTQPNVVMGKMAYMPPEQARGDPIDFRADLFACGVLAYELLTNERYYEGMSASDIWQVAGRGGFMPRSWGSIEPGLASILARALHPEARRRFPTCGDFRDALHGYMRERLPGNPARIVRQLMEQLFEEELARERAAMARFSAVTAAASPPGAEPTKSHAVSLAGSSADQRTDETSASHAGRMPPPTVGRSTEDDQPVSSSSGSVHDDQTRIDQQRPASPSSAAPPRAPGAVPTASPSSVAPLRTPGPLPAVLPSSAAPRQRGARPAGSPTSQGPRGGGLPAGSPTSQGPRGGGPPAGSPTSQGPRGGGPPAGSPTSQGPRGGGLPAGSPTSQGPRGGGLQPAGPVTTGASLAGVARTPGGLPAATPASAGVAGRGGAVAPVVADDGTQRVPRQGVRADPTQPEDDDDATMRHVRNDDEDATVRHRVDHDATERHRRDRVDAARLGFARARRRSVAAALVAVVAAIVAVVAIVATRDRGGPPAASTPAASTPAASTPAASTPAASTPAAPTPAAPTPAAPTPAAPTPAAPKPAASTPAASTAAAPTRAAPTASAPGSTVRPAPAAHVDPAAGAAAAPAAPPSASVPPALVPLAAERLWRKLERRDPEPPCVAALLRRVEIDRVPFSQTAAEIDACARALNIKP